MGRSGDRLIQTAELSEDAERMPREAALGGGGE
jgi:hypothetical protein